MKDEGLSAFHGTHIKRGAFGLFLAAIESGRVKKGSILIVESLDRISRDEPIIAQGILAQIINSGIKVITTIDEQEYDRESVRREPMKLVYSLLLFVRSNEESETKRRRVKESIIRQILCWKENGKGEIIRCGTNPYWVKDRNDKRGFELITERVNVVKHIISLYMNGCGFNKIVRHLNDTTEPFNKKKWYANYIQRFIKNRTLVGDREITIDNETFIINNYYPKLITDQEFSLLQYEINKRASTKSQRKIPNIFTGMKVSYCSNCGATIAAKNYASRVNKQGNLADGFRRIRCASDYKVSDCINTKSVKSIFVERALLEFCQDKLELSSIIDNDDKTTETRVKLNNLKGEHAMTEHQINKLADAFLTIENPPVSLIDRLRSLEDKKSKQEKNITLLESELVALDSALSKDLVEEWQSITSEVYNLDEESRLKVRQIVKKTFKRIDIDLHYKITPVFCDETMDDIKEIYCVKLVLHFHNGNSRTLLVNKETGEMEVNFDHDNPPWM